MYIILNSDDAGMARSINRAIILAWQRRVLTSTSLMAPCPCFSEIASFALSHPTFDVGVHLTLTSEWDDYRWRPLSPRHRVRSLVDGDGYFWKTADLVAAYCDPYEAEIEMQAQ